MPSPTDKLQEKADKLQEKVDALEKRLQSYDMWVKVAVVVAAVFGIGGTFGAAAIKEAKREISQVQDDVAGMSDVANKAKKEIDDHSEAALSEFTAQLAARLEKEPLPTLRAKEIRLVDERDDTMIFLGPTSEGEPVINVWGKKKGQFAGMSVETIWVQDGDSQSNISVLDGSPFVRLDKDGNVVWIASVDDDGGWSEVRNLKGKGVVTSSTQDGGKGGYLVVAAPDGEHSHTISP